MVLCVRRRRSGGRAPVRGCVRLSERAVQVRVQVQVQTLGRDKISACLLVGGLVGLVGWTGRDSGRGQTKLGRRLMLRHGTQLGGSRGLGKRAWP